MNFGELIAAVIPGGFEPVTSKGFSDAIKEFLNEGYMDIASRELSCFEETEELAIKAGIIEYDIAEYCRKPYNAYTEENGPFDFQDKKHFDYVKYANTYYKRSHTTSGPPKCAYIWAKKLTIEPPPDKDYTGYFSFYQIPERLVDDDDEHLLPADKENLLILFAQSRIKSKEKDYNGARELKAEYEAKLNNWVIDDFNEKVKDKLNMAQLEREYYSKMGRRVR